MLPPPSTWTLRKHDVNVFDEHGKGSWGGGQENHQVTGDMKQPAMDEARSSKVCDMPTVATTKAWAAAVEGQRCGRAFEKGSTQAEARGLRRQSYSVEVH